MGLLELPNECGILSLEIINQAMNSGFKRVGIDPKGIAAAAIYMITKRIPL